MLTVQAAAARVGLSAHTLRYYERIGLMPFVARSDSSGHRRYTERDLQVLEFLKRLRATGMSIQQMQHYVTLAIQGDSTVDERRELLIAHEARVREQLAELQTTLGLIEDKLERYEQLSHTLPLGTKKTKEEKSNE
jgi:DNA-binding transcriptional MerR regulator